jgi:hypothetical protein
VCCIAVALALATLPSWVLMFFEVDEFVVRYNFLRRPNDRVHV